MPARVLVIGLDSVSATFLDRWGEAGHLPHLAALRRRASQFQLDAECMETLPGAIWSDIAFGEPCERHGLFYLPEQFRPEDGRFRPIRESEVDITRTFWGAASAAGRRCAVIDVPFMPLLPGFNGAQLREFAVHAPGPGRPHIPQLFSTNYIEAAATRPFTTTHATPGSPPSDAMRCSRSFSPAPISRPRYCAI